MQIQIDNMLEKNIKKFLIETKEKKERFLIEQQIVKDRISIILGDIDSIESFQKLSEEKQIKISFRLMNEISFFNEHEILNEGLGDYLKQIFGNSITGSIVEVIAEPFVNSILSALGLSGYFKNFLTSFLTSRLSELIAAFNDCNKMTTLISQALVEAVFMTLQQEKGFGGYGFNLIRNELGGVIKSTKFIQGIEAGISKIVCGLFDKYGKNAEDLVSKLKPTAAVGS